MALRSVCVAAMGVVVWFGGGDDEGRPRTIRSAYGPIRAWYAIHAMRGVMDMTLGQSMASMAGAEEFERNLAVSAGEGPGPIASLMTRQANQQMFAGIAAEQQFGWLNRIPQDLFGGIGGQRMYQASRFAAASGHVRLHGQRADWDVRW